ncbi:endonuclease/exonuclease/phosphatase family protein [Actinokineospora inagensis]|uniref:endonuclease/exonuclease/phosphatase family protein n=1 Tax=Actinokineospora inagensis TaxID=103730 RepID=UPI00146FB745
MVERRPPQPRVRRANQHGPGQILELPAAGPFRLGVRRRPRTPATGTHRQHGHLQRARRRRAEGGNVAALLQKAEQATAALSPRPTGWVMLGDFNIEPNYPRAYVPQRVWVVDPAAPTHGIRTIDYLIWSDQNATEHFAASVPLATEKWGSDHRPVRFIKKPRGSGA